MEFLSVKRNRNRRKKRNLKRRRRRRMKLEVRSVKCERLIKEPININVGKEEEEEEIIINDTMQAEAFWKNYVAAHEWQKRHSVTWWRSRCLALENENEILRNKIRSLVELNHKQINNDQIVYKQQQNNYKQNKYVRRDYKMHEDQDEEDLEFHVDEDMKKFLEHSLRHRMELKQQREKELADIEEKSKAFLEDRAISIKSRNENGKLLYGDASPTIMAMETALKATIERHIDVSKPIYWPNIPLRP